MRALLNKICVLFLVVCLGLPLMPHSALAGDADVGLVYSRFRFSQLPLVAGQTVRMYAAVKNVSETDMSGEVSFSLPSGIVKHPVPFTAVANGAFEEIWIDFVVPEDPFNMYVQVRVDGDTDSSNNSYLSPLYQPLMDRDRDTVVDDVDNCPGSENTTQTDTDNDGIGDVCDETPAVVEDPALPPVETPVLEPSAPVASESAPQPTAKDTLSSPLVADASPGQAVSQEPAESLTHKVETAQSDSVVPSGIKPVGSVIVSPNARFSYTRIGWNVYVFSVLQPQLGAVYTWETSDGRTHDGTEATFHFPTPGSYAVKLTTSKIDGTFVSEEVTVHTSFFHLENPWLVIMIAGLLVLCGIVVWQGFRRSRSGELNNDK